MLIFSSVVNRIMEVHCSIHQSQKALSINARCIPESSWNCSHHCNRRSKSSSFSSWKIIGIQTFDPNDLMSLWMLDLCIWSSELRQRCGRFDFSVNANLTVFKCCSCNAGVGPPILGLSIKEPVSSNLLTISQTVCHLTVHPNRI